MERAATADRTRGDWLFYAPQMAAYGGMERHVCTLAATASARGHRVRLLTTSNSLGGELRRGLAEARVELRELPAARMAASKTRKLLWLLLEVLSARRAARWEVIYTNGQSALARWVWLAARPGQARVVHHHHTAADEAERAGWAPGYRRALLRAPEVVGCSRFTCAGIERELGRPCRFLPYLTRECVAAPAVAERPPGSPLRFGFVGRLVAEKGIDDVLALADMPGLEDIAWEIHGEGPAYPPETFAGRARVAYRGAFRSAEQHARVLLGLDAVVLFSRHNEGMPLSLIEATSAGLPWIATDRGGVREIAEAVPYATVLSAEADAAARRAAVRDLADRLRAGDCSRAAQRRAYDAAFAPPLVSENWIQYLRAKTGSPIS